MVEKPAGILSARVPGDERESLFDLVKEYVRGKRKRPTRVWIIHRLDKDASGLLVFAKTEKAYNWLKEDLRARRMHRLYLAVVEGEITDESRPETVAQDQPSADALPASIRKRVRQLPSGTIQSFIQDDDHGNVASVGIGDVAREGARQRRVRDEERPPGPRPAGRAGAPLAPDEPRLAVTHYRVLATGQGRSLLQLRLETGRKNQVRVHMQEFKHPIVGDARYGASTNPISRLALHATELGFTHPTTGQTVRYLSPAPASFYRALGMQPPKASPDEAAGPPSPLESPAATPPVGEEPLREATAAPPGDAGASPGGRRSPETSWDHVAAWYDQLLEDDRSDHFRHTIIPGTMRLLNPPMETAGYRVLDIACGQGLLSRRLAEIGAEVVGVDASPKLIEAARKHAAASTRHARFEVGDARFLQSLPADLRARPFDAAACIMALMNIDPLEPVLRGAASMIRPGGILAAVILHPAFRSPGQTSWGWERAPAEREGRERRGGGGGGRGRNARPQPAQARQFRRVDGYLSAGQVPITMNPGKAAYGAPPVTTWTFHRPIQSYVKALADAGFVIQALEEWPSMRTSQPGPRAAEENRARREIPMFLGIRAVRT